MNLKHIAGSLAALLLASACATQIDTQAMADNTAYIDWEDARLFTREWGEGSPLLLIHGASANSAEMEVSLAPALEDSYRVVAYDRPGMGRSTGRPDGSGTLEGQARAAAQVIRETGLERPVVVGHSFGGSVALRLALDYPDLVSGMVLIAAPSHEWPGDSTAWYNRLSTSFLIGPVFNNLAVPVFGPARLDSAAEAVFAPQNPPANYTQDAEIGLLFRAEAFNANAEDVIDLKPEIIEQSRRYPDLDMPVSILHGDADTIVWANLHAARMKQDIKGARVFILPDMGHMPHHFEQTLIREEVDRVYSTAKR